MARNLFRLSMVADISTFLDKRLMFTFLHRNSDTSFLHLRPLSVLSNHAVLITEQNRVDTRFLLEGASERER
jgi:hypothetical protein